MPRRGNAQHACPDGRLPAGHVTWPVRDPVTEWIQRERDPITVAVASAHGTLTATPSTPPATRTPRTPPHRLVPLLLPSLNSLPPAMLAADLLQPSCPPPVRQLPPEGMPLAVSLGGVDQVPAQPAAPVILPGVRRDVERLTPTPAPGAPEPRARTWRRPKRAARLPRGGSWRPATDLGGCTATAAASPVSLFRPVLRQGHPSPWRPRDGRGETGVHSMRLRATRAPSRMGAQSPSSRAGFVLWASTARWSGHRAWTHSTKGTSPEAPTPSAADSDRAPATKQNRRVTVDAVARWVFRATLDSRSPLQV